MTLQPHGCDYEAPCDSKLPRARLSGDGAEVISTCHPARCERCGMLQSTATAKAVQTSCMRPSPNLPRRMVSVPTETLSTESRLTADRRGMGSSPGLRSTSLASPRIVVVHGAIRTRRSLGIAASRDRTTTGRRLISDSSHHHTSPLAGKSFTTRLPPHERTRGRPIRPLHRGDVRRMQRIRRRSRLRDASLPTHLGPRRAAPHH